MSKRTPAYNAWIFLLVMLLIGSCSGPALYSTIDPQGAPSSG